MILPIVERGKTPAMEKKQVVPLIRRRNVEINFSTMDFNRIKLGWIRLGKNFDSRNKNQRGGEERKGKGGKREGYFPQVGEWNQFSE